MDVVSLREKFPQLKETVYGRPLVYLDNAATSMRPSSVIDKWVDSASRVNANLHRAVHHIADLATNDYESARDYVKDYLNAESRREIIFTSGTTESINLVAYSFSKKFLSEGDEVIVGEAEHHSDIVPWQQACERQKATLKVLKIKDNGELDLEDLKAKLTGRTKIVCVNHISNVLGIVNPVEEIVRICHSIGCLVLVDGAQGIVHIHPDVQKMGCDFYVFSGHKVFAAPGTGVLYGRKELLEAMPPFLTGGEMIGNVKWSGTTWAELPQKFEAGTRNISGVPTMKPALELLGQVLDDADIKEEERKIRDYMTKALLDDKRIRLFGLPQDMNDKVNTFSFLVEHCHHEDLALILDKMGIAVRSGQMCAEPLMDRFGVSGMVRASFAAYNTLDEAHKFIECLDRAIEMLV